MKTAWNTKRRYTAAGQRIAAEATKDTVFFVDIDRHIAGSMGLIHGNRFSDEYQLRGMVISNYDLGHYTPGITDPQKQHELEALARLVPSLEDNA